MLQFIPAKEAQQAVTVLVHGLNNHPGVLTDLADFLTGNRSAVLLVTLTGHNEDKKALRDIKKEQWFNDLKSAYQMAREKSEPDNLLYFIGYSIGALINLNVLSETITYDKMVLLAPAIAPRWTLYLAKPIYRLWGGFPIYSIVPPGYGVHSYLPAIVYKLIFDLISSLEKKSYQYANLPVIVIVDQEDEVVSLSKLRKLITRFKLSHWRILILDSEEVVKETKYHHLIINKRAMGRKNWQNLTSEIKTFFNLGNE